MSVQTQNVIKQLNFSGPHIEARLVDAVNNFPIDGRTIVINPSIENVYVGEAPRKPIPPFSSTILVDTVVEQATSLILLRVKEETNIGNIILEPGWELYGDLVKKMAGKGNGLPFPLNTPLWRSPQDDAGYINFDPLKVLGTMSTSPNGGGSDPLKVLDLTDTAQDQKKFQIKVNLWFATNHTNCFIHNQHSFIEVHTQVYGLGRMQKFTAQDHRTLYEDQLMISGYTTPVPYCRVGPDGSFVYPWHQYYADSECIWLAIEYHPCYR